MRRKEFEQLLEEAVGKFVEEIHPEDIGSFRTRALNFGHPLLQKIQHPLDIPVDVIVHLTHPVIAFLVRGDQGSYGKGRRRGMSP